MTTFVKTIASWLLPNREEPKPDDSEDWDDWVMVRSPVDNALSESMFSTSLSDLSRTYTFHPSSETAEKP